MRIWDIPPKNLCARHLLGEHRELHAVWSIITNDKKGYSCHPETQRWRGKLKALYGRHEELVEEMKTRGYRHASPLNVSLATGDGVQAEFVDTPAEQRDLLKQKGCQCRLD